MKSIRQLIQEYKELSEKDISDRAPKNPQEVAKLLSFLIKTQNFNVRWHAYLRDMEERKAKKETEAEE